MSDIVGQSMMITRPGYERLHAQLAALETDRRAEVAGWLRDAREDGGPDENPDHAEALAAHATLERRISELQCRLATARVVEYTADGTADIGAHVRLRLATGTMAIQLVGPAEADPAQRRLSIDSPVGRAIRGHRPGDVVDADAPGGAQRVEILEVEAPDSSIALAA